MKGVRWGVVVSGAAGLVVALCRGSLSGSVGVSRLLLHHGFCCELISSVTSPPAPQKSTTLYPPQPTRTHGTRNVEPKSNRPISDEEWSDDEKAEGGKGGEKDDLEELDEVQLGELLSREQRARHMGLSQVSGFSSLPSSCRFFFFSSFSCGRSIVRSFAAERDGTGRDGTGHLFLVGTRAQIFFLFLSRGAAHLHPSD